MNSHEYHVTPPPWVSQAFDRIYNWAQDIEDVPERAEACGALIKQLNLELEEPLSKLRRAALRELKSVDWSYRDMEAAFGLSSSRLHQIIAGKDTED